MKNRGFLNRARIGVTAEHRAEPAIDDPAAVISDPVQPASQDLGKPQRPRKEPSTPAPKPSATSARRYTLILWVPGLVAERLTSYLARFPQSRRSAARRALVSAFYAGLNAEIGANIPPTPGPPTRLRLDLRLTDQKRDELMVAANAGPFEPTSTALARQLSPQFAAFLSRNL